MNIGFKKRQVGFLIQLVALTILLLSLHSYLLYHFANETMFLLPIWQIYCFHFIVTALFYTVINHRYSKGKIEIFNTFMIITFLKMFLAILFMLPLFLSTLENKQLDVFNFFIPYFLYLSFEVYSLTKFLQKNKG